MGWVGELRGKRAGGENVKVEREGRGEWGGEGKCRQVKVGMRMRIE